MIFAWLARRKQEREQIRRDADALIAEHGDAAYHIARDRALSERLYKIIDAERSSEQWNQVRFEIRRRQGRRSSDTGTRYLEDQ
jgi:hypothetical protein